MVCTNDDLVARKLKGLRDNGRVDSVEEIECYGYCSRLDNLHAAILDMKFNYFDSWVERRREIAERYDKELSNLAGIRSHPKSGDDYFDVYQNYVISTSERDRLAEHLRTLGIEVLISWPTPLHRQKALGLDHFNLPVTERVSKEVLSIPMYPELTDDEVDTVVDAIRTFKI